MSRPDERLPPFPEELAADFEPERVLGRGGMGVVFLARSRSLDRDVAIKLLPLSVSRHYASRLQREAAILAGLRHPNVLEVMDYGQTSLGPYLVMEYLEGKSLERAGRLKNALGVMLAVADGLQACHDQGVFHRDLKPANIFLTRDGRPVLLDFGLALDTDRTRLTETGQLPGTYTYTAPEIFHGAPASARTDWYSWGVTLYELEERRRPWKTEQVMKRIMEGAELELVFERLAVGSPVRHLIERCLSEDPRDRPGRREHLERILAGEDISRPSQPAPPPRPPPPTGRAGLLARGLGLVLLGVVLGAVVTRLATSSTGPAPGETEVSTRAPDRPDDLGFGPRALEESARLDRLAPARDPLVWHQEVVRLPAVRTFYQWMEEGGRADELPEQTRRDLAEAGRAYQAAGLPDPYFPHVHLRPLAVPMVTPEGWGSSSTLKPPARVSGWMGRAAERWVAFRRIRDELQAEVMANKQGPYPGGVQVEALATILTLSRGTIDVFLNEALPATRHRISLRPWLRPLTHAGQEMMLAAARAISREPEQAILVTLLMCGHFSGFRLIGTTGFARLPVAWQHGVRPSSPAHLVLAGRIEQANAEVLRNIGADGSAHTRAAHRHFAAALEGLGGKTQEGHLMRYLAGGLIELYIAERDLEKIRSWADRFVPELRNYPPEVRRSLAQLLGQFLERERSSLGVELGHVRTVREVLRLSDPRRQEIGRKLGAILAREGGG